MALQDYNTYTEQDPNGRLVINTITNLLRSDTTTWIYKDFGVGFFGDLPLGINFEGEESSSTASSSIHICAISNNIAGFQTHLDNTFDSYHCFFNKSAGGALFFQVQSSTAGFPTDSVGISTSTRYYFTLTRSGTTVLVDTFTDANRTVPLAGGDLSVTSSATAFRYLYAINNYDTGGNGAMSGIAANLELLQDTHVVIVDSQDLRMVNGGTIAVQMSPDSTGSGAEGRLIDKDDGGTDGYAVMVTGTNQIQLSVGGVDSITGNNVYTDSEYTLVVAEFTADGRRMWINNVEVSLTNSTDSTLPGDVAGSVFIGARASGGAAGGFDGQLDEIPMWNRKLTDIERESIYNGNLGMAII